MRLNHYLLLLLSLAFTSCDETQETEKQEIKTQEKSEPKELPLFTKLTEEESGFFFLNEINQTSDVNVLAYENYYNGGGVGVGDVNADGLPDLFLTGNIFGGRLYLNKGNLQFEQISESANVFTTGFTTDVSFVDINQDGYQDIYLCKSLSVNPEDRRNVLLLNNGDNTFTDQAEAFGIADNGYSNQSLFFDYDNDGDLDLYLMNHRVDFDNAQTIHDTKGNKGNIVPSDQFWTNHSADRLYENKGDLTFEDVTELSGIINNDFSLSAVATDINNDGYTDLFVANDFTSKDHVYINQGNGKFVDEVEKIFGHIAKSSMGSDVADFNNDGLVDVVNVDMTPEDNYRQKQLKGASPYDLYHMAKDYGFYHQISRNMLQLNNGDGTFSEIGQMANMAYTDWSWSALFADFDNDGWKDLFISNGHYKDITDLDYLKYKSVEAVDAAGGLDHVDMLELIDLMTSTKIRNYVFQNDQNLRFNDVSEKWGISDLTHSNGSAYADLDLDGDLDLVINNFNQEAFLYRNNAVELGKGNYLTVQLKGDKGNLLGYGAKVIVESDAGTQLQECSPYRGFLSSLESSLHFGLGGQSEVSSVSVIWPNGKKQTINNVKANQFIEFNISEATDQHVYISSTNDGILKSLASKIDYNHKEDPFIDFKQEPLLEHMFSNRGPVMAVADVDGNGTQDLYIGGSAGISGELWLQGSNGEFGKRANSDFQSDSKMEDGGCEFFDANNDGLLDLYVSSGSNQFDDGAMYQDRLYIGDGKGGFKKSEEALPKIESSTSCVVPIDYDKDGDLDLFVGGFVKKNAFPLTGKSWLLQNENGAFIDQSGQLPESGQLGIVNDAITLSEDELVVVGEWVKITFLKSNGVGFEEKEIAGLEKSDGWWNCVKANDFDGDGDLDLVVGNRGLNTMFKASAEHPAKLFWGDFDDNSDLDAFPVYYYKNDQAYFPKHGLDQMFMQMKGIRKIFKSYEAYSSASLNDIIPDQSNSLTVHWHESVYIENNGDGTMSIIPLPIEAQFSYVQDILVEDLNKDGKDDIVVVGNNYGVDIEMGKSDASYGLVLINKGGGNFDPLSVKESGFSTKGLDSRYIKLVAEGIIAVANNNGPLQLFEIQE